MDKGEPPACASVIIRRVRNPDTKEFEPATIVPNGYGPLRTIYFPSTRKTYLENALDEFGGFEYED